MVSTHGRKQGKNCKNLKAIRLEKRKRCEKYLKELLAKKKKPEYILYAKIPVEYEYQLEPSLPCSAWQAYLNCFYEETDSEKKAEKSVDSENFHSEIDCDGSQAKEKYYQYEKLLASDSSPVKIKEEKEEKEDKEDDGSITDFEPSSPESVKVKEEVSDIDLSDSEINNLMNSSMQMIEETDAKDDDEEEDPISEADTAFNFKHSKRKKFEYRSYLSPFEVRIVLDDKADPESPNRANLRSSNRIGDPEVGINGHTFYQKHRRKKNLGPRHFQCSLCGGRFISKGNLKAHCDIVHSNERNYECSDCGMRFKTKYHLKTHYMNIHKKNKPYSDIENDKPSGQPKDPNRYPKRERAKISDKSDLTCNVCGVVLNNRRLLNMHMVVAHTRKYTKKTNSSSQKLKRNASRRAYNLRELSSNDAMPQKRIIRPPRSPSEEIRIFECNDCSAFYSSKCLVKNHILETHLFYHCEYPKCGLVFKKKANLQRHHNRVHFKVIPTKNKPKKLSLQKKSTNSDSGRFECDYCKDMFRFKSFLALHILRKHPTKDGAAKLAAIAGSSTNLKVKKRGRPRRSLNPAKDGESSRTALAAGPSTLKIKKKRGRPGRPLDPSISQRKHGCDKCPMAFKTRSHLRAHCLQRHSEERNFVCTVCDAQFKMKGILKTHMLRMHNTFKP